MRRHWRYDATREVRRPEVGVLLVLHHKVYRVVDVIDRAETDWSAEERRQLDALKPEFRHEYRPFTMRLRPIENDGHPDPVRARRDDRSVGYRDENVRYGRVSVYDDEHYPVCARCGEPTPCRETLAKRDGERAMEHMARYEDPDRCPACDGVITNRQGSVTFPENLRVPLGPPVTYHLRAKCRHSAAEYEKEWAAADPENRTPTLSCLGWVTTHADETYSCSVGHACPGPTTFHKAYAMCTDRECCAPRGPSHIWDCHPWEHYTQREVSGA